VDSATGRRVWTASVSSGARRAESLDPGPGFDEATMRAVPLGNPRTAPVLFATRRGMAVFDDSGQLVGRDAWEGKVEVLPPEVGDGVLVAVETTRSSTEAGSLVRVHLLEAPSARVRLSRDVVMHDDPRDVALLDGRVLIGTEAVTVVLNAPAGQ
jgi:hypothetical protein